MNFAPSLNQISVSKSSGGNGVQSRIPVTGAKFKAMVYVEDMGSSDSFTFLYLSFFKIYLFI